MQVAKMELVLSIFWLLFFVLNCEFVSGQNSTTSVFTFRHREVLEPNGLILEWNLNLEAKIILLTVSTQSNESTFTAIGLTKKGKLEAGADVIVTRVGDDGSLYVADMVALNQSSIVADGSQDWQLVAGERFNSGGSRITIWRDFETCDEQDYPFNTDLIHVIWAQGQYQNQTNSSSSSPQLDLTFKNLESRPVYFLDSIPVLPANETRDTLQTFRISRNFKVPSRHTTYWCTVHRMNRTLSSKHHIVGFAPYFSSTLASKHVHHQIVYRCTAPIGSSAESFFQPFVSHPGEECYLHQTAQLPYNYCRETVHESAAGGFRKFEVFPDAVGFPIGDPSSVEYFVYETHYNNPEGRSDLEFETGVDFLYTSQLRRNDGGILLTGYGVLGNWVMPPQTKTFEVAGHCNSFCTTRMFLGGGVDVLGIRLHAHLSSRRMRIKHYRNGVELPFIHNDQNYDFNFQQWRWLYNPVRIEPGDQITVQCGYDNTWENGTKATISGFATHDEMCHAWLLISRRLPYQYCTSELPTTNLFSRFGIQGMNWEVEPHDRIISSATNPLNVGKSLRQVVTNIMSNWTSEQRTKLENEQLYSDHASSCPNVRAGALALRALSVLQGVLPEGVGVPIPEYIRNVEISLKTISTPVPTSRARYIRANPEYKPNSSCSLARNEIGGGNELTTTSTPASTQSPQGIFGQAVAALFEEVLERVGDVISLPFGR